MQEYAQQSLQLAHFLFFLVHWHGFRKKFCQYFLVAVAYSAWLVPVFQLFFFCFCFPYLTESFSLFWDGDYHQKYEDKSHTSCWQFPYFLAKKWIIWQKIGPKTEYIKHSWIYLTCQSIKPASWKTAVWNTKSCQILPQKYDEIWRFCHKKKIEKFAIFCK